MKRVKLLFLFLLVNFGGLALGGWLMNNGPASDWYINLNQAPWTPPGWVFGVAWTTIMLCFSIYLAYLFNAVRTRNLKISFGLALFLNVIWNYIFFNQHMVTLGLIIIQFLTLMIFYFFFNYKAGQLRSIRFLLLPYMIWMCIATSLNAYVVFNN